MRSVLRLSLLTGSLLASGPALAQAVDYAALSEVVGEPVTTSVIGKPQRASELPASAVIITSDDIARSPARDVPGLLKSYAGIDVNRWTAGQSDVAVRGGVQTYNATLLVLVDGRQVYLDHYGFTDWNLLGVPLEDIEQIELVRGPATALFGFNAATGVVNIITRRARGQAQVSASGEGGNHGYSRFALSASAPLSDTVGAKLTAGRLREGERAIPAGLSAPPAIPDVHADSVSGQLTGRWDRTELTLDGGYASNHQLEFLPTQLLQGQKYKMSHVALTAKQDTDWGGLSVNAYTNWLNARYGGGDDQSAVGQAGVSLFDNRIIVAQAAALVRLGSDNTLRAGAEYRHNRARSNTLFSDVVSYDVGSANLMLDLHPASRLGVTLAGRLDRFWLGQSGAVAQPMIGNPSDFDQAFTRLSFNAALVGDLGGGAQLRLNGGRGYQLPSLTFLGLRRAVTVPLPLPLYITGRADLRPVAVWSAEAGYIQTLGKVRLEATGFWTRTDNVIATPGDALELAPVLTPAPVLVSQIRPIGDFTTYGVELSASGQHGRVRWRANYTLTETNGDLPPIASPLPFPFSPQMTTPRHKANVELGYDAGRWYATALGRYTAATRQFSFATSNQLLVLPVNDAVTLDMRLGLRLRRGVELFAAGENLTLADGGAVSPIPADRRVRAGLKLGL